MPETAVELAGRLAALGDAALEAGPASAATVARLRTLLEHLRSFVLPRAAALDAPLLVLVFGPTGSGKSSLTNSLAGERASETGVLRPTTRHAVLVATRADRDALMSGPLSAFGADDVGWFEAGWQSGVAIVDAPDIDSVETANRELADRLVEAADVAAFVTTATRYADAVPWHVLRRVAERRLPLIVVVNRLPPARAAADEVLRDVRRLLGRSALVGSDGGGELTVIPVREGELGDPGFALDATAVRPLTERVDRLRADAGARRRLALRSLEGAVAGLEPLVQTIADDLERDAIDADAVRRAADSAFRTELLALRGETHGGAFLREEVLRRWQDFVGADALSRSLSRGLARAEASVRSVFKRSPDPAVSIVRDETLGELVALAESHAGEASRTAAAAWTGMPSAAPLVDADPALWGPSPGLHAALRSGVDGWLESIDDALAETAAPKRRLARGAATGVNAAGVGVMLAVFLHTGGLTGAEVGVAAGTAVVNQRLLETIFGEAAIVRVVEDAGRRLNAMLDATFEAEARRYTTLVSDPTRLRGLAAELRAAAAGVRHVADELAVAPDLEAGPGPRGVEGGTEQPEGRRETAPSRGLRGLLRRVIGGEGRGAA